MFPTTRRLCSYTNLSNYYKPTTSCERISLVDFLTHSVVWFSLLVCVFKMLNSAISEQYYKHC